MTNAAFEKLKERFKQKSEQKDKNGKGYNTEIYPFWTMDFDESVKIRILQDSNPDNEDVFFIKKFEHKFSIAGRDRTVLCINRHYNEACPFCELSQKYYKTEGKDSKNGLYYYVNRRYYMRALLITDPLPPNDETGEKCIGKVKLFRTNKDLIEKMMMEIAEKLPTEPWDYKEGYDFKIMKKKGSGGHADYIIGSGFEWTPSAIPEEVYSKLEPNNLNDCIPANPGLALVTRLLNSHISGSDETSEDSSDGAPTADNNQEASSLPNIPEFASVKEPPQRSVAITAAEEVTEEVPEDDDDRILKEIMERRTAKKQSN